MNTNENALSAQIMRFHTLCKALRLDDDAKKSLVYQYSNGRVESSKYLTQNEIHELNNSLQKELNSNQSKLNTMRRKYFALMHQLGYHIEDTQELDYNRIEGWRLKYGKYGEVYANINDYPAKELAELITQVEKMVAKKPEVKPEMKVVKGGKEE